MIVTRLLFIATLILAAPPVEPPSAQKTITFQSGGAEHTASLFGGSESGFGFIAIGEPPDATVSGIMPVWDLQAADLDGDGDDELLVGTWSQRGKQRGSTHRTIWVMRYREGRLEAVWRGSRLPHSFERFTVEPGERDRLVTHPMGPGMPPTRYRWTGFGFAADGIDRALRLVFVGDLAIARGAPQRIEVAPTPQALRAVATADVAIANLETTLGTPQPETNPPRLTVSQQELERASMWGVDAVTRANNHALDAGTTGWKRTTDGLSRTGIRDVTNATLAPNIQLVAATLHPPRERAVFPVLVDDSEKTNFVETVRTVANSGTVIVSLHGGPEGHTAPTDSDREFTKTLIAAGAAAVIWHGAHTPAPVERVDGAIVAWNLGDFALKRRNDGCALHLLASPDGSLRMTSGPWACKE